MNETNLMKAGVAPAPATTSQADTTSQKDTTSEEDTASEEDTTSQEESKTAPDASITTAATTVVAPATTGNEVASATLWPSLRSNPGYAAELLAVASVNASGRAARAYVSWLRDTYPTATDDALARLVTRRFVRAARIRGAAVGLAGSLAVLADLVMVGWAQAQLVLNIAAAYGHDPTDPRRAAELLVIFGLHPDVPSAADAIERARTAGESSDRSAAGRMAGPLWRVTGRLVTRLSLIKRAGRLLPGGGAVVAAVLDSRSAERLAARAVRHYRPGWRPAARQPG